MSVANCISICIATQANNTYSTTFQHITKYFIKKLLTLLTTDIYMVFLLVSFVGFKDHLLHYITFIHFLLYTTYHFPANATQSIYINIMKGKRLLTKTYR